MGNGIDESWIKTITEYREKLIKILSQKSNILYLFPIIKGCVCLNNGALVVFGSYIPGEIFLKVINGNNKVNLKLNHNDYYLLRKVLIDE